MITLEPEDRRFLQRRRAALRVWPMLGSGLLLALVMFGLWIYLRSPLLIDPTEIVRRLEDGGIDPTALVTLAATVPMLFLGCLILLAVLILATFARFRTERRYLALLARWQAE